MSVGRICCREVYTAAAGESAQVAARRMREHSVGTLVVVDETARPVGVVTDRDLVVRVMADGKDPQSTTLGDVMTRQVRVVSEETPIESALSQLRQGAFRRLIVVDPHGHLAGLVSLDDILMLLAEETNQIGRLLDEQRTRIASAAK